MQTRHFASKGLCLALAISGLALSSHADTYETPPPPRPITPAKDEAPASVAPRKDGRLQVAPTSDAAPDQKPYVLKAEPRPPMTGYSVSVFAGASVAQQNDLSTFGGIPADAADVATPVGGLKFGYVWPFGAEPIDQFDMETASVGGVHLSGGLELEAFYVRSEQEISNAAGTTNLDLNMGFFMLNANLQAQWGKFRLYGGPGVGIALVSGEDDTEGLLAYQIMGGLDYFISPDWSIFSEYKYLIVNDLSVSTPSGTADYGDQFGQHIVTFGVRKHF